NVLVVGKESDAAKTEATKTARKRNKSGPVVAVVKEREFLEALRPTSAQAFELIKSGAAGLSLLDAYFQALPHHLGVRAAPPIELRGANLSGWKIPAQIVRDESGRAHGVMLRDYVAMEDVDLTDADLSGAHLGPLHRVRLDRARLVGTYCQDLIDC